MSFIHADIFFFVTTIAVVVIAVGIVVALVYLIKILRTISDVSKKVKTESEEIINDVRTLRADLKKKSKKFFVLRGFFKKIFNRVKKNDKQ